MTAQAPRRDQRRGFRAEVAFPVNVAFGASSTAEATAIDVSACGMRLFCQTPLDTSGDVALAFAFPEAPVRSALGKLERRPTHLRFDTIAVRGRALTQKYDPDRRAHVYGIAFVAMSEDTAEAIHQFVHLTQIPRG